MTRMLRGAYVIARRDFGATVLSKAFLLFLIGPLFPVLFGGVFGSIGAHVAAESEKPVVAVVSSEPDFAALTAARAQLVGAIDDDDLVHLAHYAPERDVAAQAKRLLATRIPPIRSVLTGGLAAPHLTGPEGNSEAVAQLRVIIGNARSAGPPAALGITETQTSSGSLVKDRAITAQIGQMVLFVLSMLLCGMLLSQLIEEKSNKIIEIVAAAVPIDSLFVGKLFAMLAASIVGIIVWTSCGAAAIALLKTGGLSTLPTPAVGWPMFLLFVIVYFAMNYLLLGAAFLTIGAQASTVREVQTMSMPVTFSQVVIFGFAATAVGAPDSAKGIFAAVFPLSSPMVMLARAAQEPELWPHLLALCWQAIWVAVILRIGSHLFRKTVLKSGPRTKGWRFRRT
ncbi:ABC transporter permease [Sphingomonas sp.]|uniref:ABC transporter permease n=1 Tax=Sphingomonas sp. TaxID=28214 RepID=UPI0025D0290D|nr:ABC transporter permease [Sphingomonas sp.]MBV9529027.1 ABC transporter permease [Sphingomonas sp.]